MTVNTGIATFHPVMELLARASHRMPIRFSTTKNHHQDDRHDDAEAARASGVGPIEVVRPMGGRQVLDEREHLDRRHRGCLQI